MRRSARPLHRLSLAIVALLVVAVAVARGLEPMRAHGAGSSARPVAARPRTAGGTPSPTDRVVVHLRSGSSPAAVAALARRVGGVTRGRVSHLGDVVISVPERLGVAAALRRLSGDPLVASAEPDYRVHIMLTPNDAYYARQWAPQAVFAPKAWDYTKGSPNTIVAVVDTGVAAHAELSGRLVPGYDFVNGDSNATDDNGHGTAVAGVIGATGDNGAGIAGLDWNARVMPVKVMDANGSGYTSDIAQGVIWAADHGARVINMSLGGPDYSSTFKSAIAYAYDKGAVVVAAAGNEASNATEYPAAYPDVLSVSALNGSTLADFSNYGANTDLTAPGQSVYSLSRTGGYAYWSGTSFSSPMVSGVASLVLGRNPTLTSAQVVHALVSSADDLGASGWDQLYGWGRVDAAKALAAAGLPADKTPPTASVSSPVPNATVWGGIPLRATAHDDRAVARVVFAVDGNTVGSDASAPYDLSLDASTLASGWHYVTATAYDAAGNAGVSSRVWIRVADGG